MFAYRIKIVISQYKLDEFLESMRSLSPKILEQEECVSHNVYRDADKDNICAVVGEWKTPQAMGRHFQTHEFDVLIGAARVLGETFTINISEVSRTGGLELVEKLHG